ncbi:hypothetical protein [Nocardiopsis sp. RV163]|uniref:hypothetical protein n=1 Tax=Nocardiopsis sp. RV163 TaxID=1661388 RepID=UPI001F1B8EFF|nr:hypothetical protein [Nocardiopsis sp. RV163]
MCLRLAVRDPFPLREIQEAVYACSGPDDMLEHLYVEMCDDQAELVFFLHEDVGDRATATVLRLWRNAVRGIPSLEEWTVLEAGPVHPADPGLS